MLDLAWGVEMFTDLYVIISVNRPIECIYM